MKRFRRNFCGLEGDKNLSIYVFLDKFSREPGCIFFADDKGALRLVLEKLLEFSRECLAMVIEKVGLPDVDSEILHVLAEPFRVSDTACNIRFGYAVPFSLCRDMQYFVYNKPNVGVFAMAH